MRTVSIMLLAFGLGILPAYSASLGACAGDCGEDGETTVDELITAINIALGSAAVGDCASVDANADAAVTIDEIVGAVNVALGGCPMPEPRLIALSREGRIASLEIADPWTVRASEDLGATIGSVRCRGGRCIVVHPSPADRLTVVDSLDLSVVDTIVLEHGADPRDVAFVGDRTVVVGQYGRPALLKIDLATRAQKAIDLSALADDDGLPETLKLASCGTRVFAQLRRVDHETDAPASIGAVLAIIDVGLPAGDRVVDADPSTPGTQGIALADRPNFDMPVDCAAGILYVAEPRPLMQGGGGYEQVDLEQLSASDFPIDTGAEVGGFEVVEPTVYWLITHTEFGPGPSSHLNLFGGVTPDTHNTFATEHVNDLALDRETDLLFFPDPCSVGAAVCKAGIYVFHAHSGLPASPDGIALGFPPIEVSVSR